MESKEIVFIGDVGVGKTSILHRLINDSFENEYCASIGADFQHKIVNINDYKVKFIIWDTAGQEKYKSLIPSYLRNASMVFLVFDITLKSSYESLGKWISFVEKYHKCMYVILGNKVDVQENREISYEEGSRYAKENNAEYFEVSAKSGFNVEYSFYHGILRLPIFQNMFDFDNISNHNSLIENISKILFKEFKIQKSLK